MMVVLQVNILLNYPRGVFGPSGSSTSRDESEKHLYEMNMDLREFQIKLAKHYQLIKLIFGSLKQPER